MLTGRDHTPTNRGNCSAEVTPCCDRSHMRHKYPRVVNRKKYILKILHRAQSSSSSSSLLSSSFQSSCLHCYHVGTRKLRTQLGASTGMWQSQCRASFSQSRSGHMTTVAGIYCKRFNGNEKCAFPADKKILSSNNINSKDVIHFFICYANIHH